jgi:hypothetical protein
MPAISYDGYDATKRNMTQRATSAWNDRVSVDSEFCRSSHSRMSRPDDDSLALHLVVGLVGAAPTLLGNLAARDRRQRPVAVGEMARHLVERLRCFDIRCDDAAGPRRHPSLFPEGLGPIG